MNTRKPLWPDHKIGLEFLTLAAAHGSGITAAKELFQRIRDEYETELDIAIETAQRATATVRMAEPAPPIQAIRDLLAIAESAGLDGLNMAGAKIRLWLKDRRPDQIDTAPPPQDTVAGTVWQHKILPTQTWHGIPFQIRKDIRKVLENLDFDSDTDWAIYNRVTDWLTAEERSPATGNGRPTIVCLCGSTRFYDTYQAANFSETMQGRIVLTVGFYPHALAVHGVPVHGETHGITPQEKAMLDELHLRKIDLADEILVLNVGQYIGESTIREIEYARSRGKTVRWLEPPPQPAESAYTEPGTAPRPEID